MRYWPKEPALRGAGNLAKPRRAEYYSNPPYNPGLRGLMLDRKPGQRGFDEDVATGTSYHMARKGEPFR